VIIADFPLRWTVASMGRLFDEGINLVVPSQRAIPASLLDPKIKSRSRLHLMVANIQVSQIAAPNTWALLLDPDGFVAEGTGDNVFLVRDGVVYTPEGRNVLRGISRDFVMHELCPSLGLTCQETNLDAYDVANADEVFITGTPFCLLPVTSFEGAPIGAGVPGPITQRLLAQWGALVDVDIAAQIRRWSIAVEGESSGPTPYEFRSSR
jgi:branched-chain amino acid aminotransferase